MTAPNTWTADQCAAAWGIAVSSWRAYVSTGRAPQPLPGYDEQRRRRWDPEQVRSWPRPGRGNYPRKPRTEETRREH